MLNQLQVEWYKAKSFPLVYVAMLLMAVAGLPYGYLKFGSAAGTGAVFSSVVSDTSFTFLITVTMSWFIGADFGSRTLTNEIKLGYSRFSAIWVRALVVYLLSAVLHFIFIAATLIGFGFAHGFDGSVFSGVNALWFATVMLQLCAEESGTVLICFAAGKPAGAVAISVVYTFLCCNILRNFFRGRMFFTLSCFCFAEESDPALLGACAVSAVLTVAVLMAVTVLLFRRAELK